VCRGVCGFWGCRGVCGDTKRERVSELLLVFTVGKHGNKCIFGGTGEIVGSVGRRSPNRNVNRK